MEEKRFVKDSRIAPAPVEAVDCRLGQSIVTLQKVVTVPILSSLGVPPIVQSGKLALPPAEDAGAC